MFPFPVDLKTDTLCDVIDHWAEVQPEAPALLEDGKNSLTYKSLSSRIEEFRKALNASGLGRGDRIGVLHSGGADMLSALLGVMSGAIAVPLNPNFSKDEFKIHMESSAVTALVMESGLDCAAQQEARRMGIPCLRMKNYDSSITGRISLDIIENATTNTGGASEVSDLALISSTSGTTSKCKTFGVTWQQLLIHCKYNTESFYVDQHDKYYSFRPLYYKGPLVNVLSSLYFGGMIFIRSQFDPDKILRDLISHGITWLICGPTFLYAIYERANESGKTEVKTALRFIRTGSGRSDSKALDELENLLGVPILETYATSESGPITSNLLPPRLNKRGTVGLPLASGVAILGADGAFQRVGHSGEIVVRGKGVISGYENDPQANAEAFLDGWFRTGDLGFFDKDGYLTLTGRVKEVINRGGEKISPTEVDAALMEHPSVAEAVSFPFFHPTLGEEVAAVVVLNRGEEATDSDLIDYLFERLASFKIPKKIIFSEDIPKSDDGKVKRQELAATFGVKVRG